MTDKAIEVAAISWIGQESWDELDPAGKFVCLEDARAAIEAYEAAKWHKNHSHPNYRHLNVVPQESELVLLFWKDKSRIKTATYSYGEFYVESNTSVKIVQDFDMWMSLTNNLPQTSGGDDV